MTILPSIICGVFCGLWIAYVLRPEPRKPIRQSEQLADKQDGRNAFLAKLYKGYLPLGFTYSDFMGWNVSERITVNAEEYFRDL
jgi:hypothetical protein